VKKWLITLIATGLLGIASFNVRAEDAKPLTTQQNKMGECNKSASEKSLKGDDRKSFMSECLKKKKPTQQEKMKTCNKDAGDKQLKGDDRKKFMSDCLKS
jgi:hypothetical protein